VPTYRAVAIADSTRTRPYGHNIAQAWQGLANVEMAALADPVEEARRTKGAEIGAKRLYADYREMLAKEQPDLVSICPHYFDLHGQWLLDTIGAGARGIYVEKPVTANLHEADAVVAAAERRGVKIAVAHQMRYHPAVLDAFQRVRDGAIGRLRRVQISGKCDARGGTHDLRVLGTHLLDCTRLLTGDPLWATGALLKNGREVTVADVFEGPEGLGKMAGDAVFGQFATASGAIIDFESYVRPNHQGATPWFGFDLYGTEGIISVRDAARHVRLYRGPEVEPASATLRWEPIETPVTFPDGKPADERNLMNALNQAAAADVVTCIEQGGEPRSSAREARTTLEMVMAILEGQRTGARVRFPLATRENPLDVWVRQSARGANPLPTTGKAG